MSSLANQLSQIASLDASRLTSRGGHPSSKSYLFPPKVAASHDLDAIFSLAQSGFEELLGLDPEFEQFEDDLFSEKAKATDRMLLNKRENEQLDVILGRCLRRLGRWVGIMAGGKCIEWLVRRFRVHEMNAEVLLQVFLPYHSSPNFPRILAILNLPNETPYHAPFASLIKQAQPIPRSYITAIVSPEREKTLRLLEDVASMIQVALREGVIHRALLTFWSGVLVELLETASGGKGAGEGLVKVLVETFVGILETKGAGKDVNAAVYPPLILLSRIVRLADGPFLALVSAIITPNTGADPSQRLLTLLVVLNDRKGWEGGLGEDAAGRLGKIEQLGQILKAAMEKYDFDTALSFILSELLETPESSHSAISQIIDLPSLSPPLVKAITTKALTVGSRPGTANESKEICRIILSSLREKYSVIVDTASQSVSDIDPSLVERPAGEMALINALSADVTSRVEGINSLLTPLIASGISELSADETQSIRTTIISRLRDTDLPILNTLYQSAAHKELVSSLCGTEDIVDALFPAFTRPHLEKEVITTHLDFAANHLVGTPSSTRSVFQRLLFPVLLPVEGRRLPKETRSALRVSKLASFELLKGVFDGEKHVPSNVLSASIAENIASSLDTEIHITCLLSQLNNEVATSKLLAHLVLISLMSSLTGTSQVKLAIQVLQALRPLLRTAQLSNAEVSSGHLVEAVERRPNSSKTSQQAGLALLVAVGNVTRPVGKVVNWLDSAENSQHSYRRLSFELYTWANSSNIPSSLSKSLLRSLLAHLGEEALLFLGAVWTSALPSILRVSALRHAGAFISAYSGADQAGTDFQLIIPALLVALADENKQVRETAVQVLKHISASILAANGHVYALDTIYGERSKSVQLLKQGDLTRYIQALVAVSNEYTVDAKRVQSVHHEALSQQSGDSRKTVIYKRAVIGSLLSHVVAWRSVHRLTLLDIFSNVHNPAVFRGILPLLVSIHSDAQDKVWVNGLIQVEKEIYLRLLFQHLTPTSLSVLQEDDGKGWRFVKSTLSASSPLDLGLRSSILGRMEKGIFNALSQNQKAEFIASLIESLEELSSDNVFASKAALSRLRLDPPSLIEVIANLSASLETASHRKKHRPDEATETDQAHKAERAIQNLSTLIDAQDWKNVPGDAQLLATLMTLLSTLLVKRQSVKEGIDYLEQEILGAVLAVVEKINVAAEIVKAHVGIEVIIKVIRATTNPRTSQRALLVAAELARLIPEAVLHNIMPIFTFMGASDFQRDDAYSFGVVEKTVSRIVPVMTQSLREKASDRLTLYKESKTFISIFTDMASRLPRHRTLPFFTHLVKSLGPEDYLAPICMLLVERSISRSTRSGMSAVQAMELPQGVAAVFEVDIKLEVVLESILEVSRLVADLERGEAEKEGFLSAPTNETDKTVRQVSALLTFSTNLAKSIVGQQCDQSVAEETVKKLLLLSSTVSTSTVSGSGVPAAVQNCLSVCMSLLSAAKFLNVVKTLLSGDREEDVVVALNILVERLPRVRPEVRVQNAIVISEIVKIISTLIRPASKANSAALSALHAISSTAQKSEDGALAEMVNKLIGVVTSLESSDQVSTLSILELTSRHLTSRVIPYIQPIVETTLKLIASSSSTSVPRQAFALQSALFDVVPTFIASKQLLTLLRTAVGYSNQELSKPVTSAVSKKVPTKTIFPVIMDLWKSIQVEGQAALIGFFELLRLVLRNADRKALPGLIKPIFAFFLDVFDLRHRLRLKKVDDELINTIEESCIGSFLELVTKLNEATFKPLFTRLYDWAVVDLAEGKSIDDTRLVERKIVLLHVMKGLLNKFKNLLSPYIGTLLPQIQDLLEAYISGDLNHVPFWTLTLDVLSKSFEVDEGAFWTDQSILTLLPILISQISVYPDNAGPIAQTLGSLAGSTTSEAILKKLNTDICMVTRDDDHHVRMAALKALNAIWDKQSDELLQFVPETVSEFLVELIEDENSDVENMARGVLARIEKLTGSLKEYLE